MAWSFVLRKLERGRSFQVSYVVTDLCGDVPKFSGAGTGAVASSPSLTSPPPQTSDPAPPASPTSPAASNG